MQDLKNFYHLVVALIANLYYGWPSKKLKVIGVTGTDGKTTTSSLIYHLLKAGGKKVAMITTVAAYIGDKNYDTGFHVTTPTSFSLQKYIKLAVEAGMEYLILETTSHALDQNRVWGINYQIGVLTNITHEHLDYHKTYDKYLAAKLKLLQRSEFVVLNKDDQSFAKIKPSLIEKKVISYSLKDPEANYTPKKFAFKTDLPADFNQLNCLAAIATAEICQIRPDKIKKAILSFKPPVGRQEWVHQKDFSVMIDFAHTPNAFEQLLPSLKKQTKGRLIHVFGSAGRRDASKRPMMGEASSKYADLIFLTAEDPRDEAIEHINVQIKRGIKDRKGLIVKEINDRAEAIKEAISEAKKGDIVVITGKGHEQSINYGQGEIPWSDHQAVKEALPK